jgi:hypothetical protein
VEPTPRGSNPIISKYLVPVPSLASAPVSFGSWSILVSQFALDMMIFAHSPGGPGGPGTVQAFEAGRDLQHNSQGECAAFPISPLVVHRHFQSRALELIAAVMVIDMLAGDCPCLLLC